MSISVIKAITKRIRLRMGSTETAARAAGVSPGVWSGYESADKPETTIPIGRLLVMPLTLDERKALIALFDEGDVGSVADLMDEAGEATEAAANVQMMVRLASRDGEITEAEKRRIRAAALEAQSQMADVLAGVA